MTINTKELTLIGKGNTAEVYSLSDDKILKLFNPSMDKFSIEREYQISLFIQEQIQNMPKVFSLEQIGSQYAIIYQRINGPNMLEAMFSQKEKAIELCKNFSEIHKILHSKKITTTGKTLPIPTVKEKLNNDITYATDLTQEEKSKICDYIKTLPDGNSICHFDFYPGNILLQNNEPFIIDWMTACYGDPCADIARTILLLTYGQMKNATPEMEQLLKNCQNQTLEIYTKEYILKNNIQKSNIEKWMLPVAAARLHESITDNEREILISLIKNYTIGK